MTLEFVPKNYSDWQVVLMGEQLVFGLLGRLLFEYPEFGWYQSLIQENVFEEIPLATDRPEVQEGMRLLNGWTKENDERLSEEAFDELREDYTRLFIGPGKVLAPPWESVYFHKERAIFQDNTLQVRQWYRRYGLESVKIHNEPDDHLGLELAFTAHLASLGLNTLERNDQAEFENLMSAQKQFLTEHTLKWVYQWSGRVEKHARTNFFKGVALITKGALQEVGDILDIEVWDGSSKPS